MKVCKYLIYKISYVLILLCFIPVSFQDNLKAEGFKIGQNGKYNPKGWWYLGAADVSLLVLPNYLNYRGNLFPIAMGIAPPIGLGIRTALVEGVLIEGGGIDTFSPIYIYWIPYMNWDKKGPFIYPKTIFFTFLGISGRGMNAIFKIAESYFRFGIGLNYSFPILSIGLEAGYVNNYYANNSLYLAITTSFGLWWGLGVERGR